MIKNFVIFRKSQSQCTFHHVAGCVAGFLTLIFHKVMLRQCWGVMQHIIIILLEIYCYGLMVKQFL